VLTGAQWYAASARALARTPMSEQSMSGHDFESRRVMTTFPAVRRGFLTIHRLTEVRRPLVERNGTPPRRASTKPPSTPRRQPPCLSQGFSFQALDEVLDCCVAAPAGAQDELHGELRHVRALELDAAKLG